VQIVMELKVQASTCAVSITFFGLNCISGRFCTLFHLAEEFVFAEFDFGKVLLHNKPRMN